MARWRSDMTELFVATWSVSLAGVLRLPHGAPRAATVETTARAAALIAGRVENAAVRRIDRDVGEAGVLVDELDPVPGLAAIRRLVDAALRIRTKEVTGRRDVHDLRIVRIDHDAGD